MRRSLSLLSFGLVRGVATLTIAQGRTILLCHRRVPELYFDYFPPNNKLGRLWQTKNAKNRYRQLRTEDEELERSRG
jgi:hypothetical protein